MKKENKFIIILILVLIVILIIGLLIGESDEKSSKSVLTDDATTILSNAQNESDNVKTKEKKEFQEINTNEYIDYYKSNTKTIILIARPTCHYCQIAEPILGKIAYDYDLDIKYLNTDNFEGDDEATVINSNEYFKNSWGTPILIIVNAEKIVDVVDGVTDTAHYIEFFEKNGFIK